MSRCFPYPPPGYEKSAALIGSIKPPGAHLARDDLVQTFFLPRASG